MTRGRRPPPGLSRRGPGRPGPGPRAGRAGSGAEVTRCEGVREGGRRDTGCPGAVGGRAWGAGGAGEVLGLGVAMVWSSAGKGAGGLGAWVCGAGEGQTRHRSGRGICGRCVRRGGMGAGLALGRVASGRRRTRGAGGCRAPRLGPRAKRDGPCSSRQAARHGRERKATATRAG